MLTPFGSRIWIFLIDRAGSETPYLNQAAWADVKLVDRHGQVINDTYNVMHHTEGRDHWIGSIRTDEDAHEGRPHPCDEHYLWPLADGTEIDMSKNKTVLAATVERDLKNLSGIDPRTLTKEERQRQVDAITPERRKEIDQLEAESIAQNMGIGRHKK